MSSAKSQHDSLKYLLIGPFDPHCGEYTFLAPPLGVWRLAGVLQSQGIDAHVFDPNCCGSDVLGALEAALSSTAWDLVGISTTGMTLRYDLQLAHIARRHAPGAVLIAGGMEATFKPERLFALGPPFDLIVLGEGERPLVEIASRLRSGANLAGIPGTALHTSAGAVALFHHAALNGSELAAAIRATPYDLMPYERYWERLENAYQIGTLPHKARREAHLAEIRSVRLITLNYCPMACSFCSATNYLHAAQGSVARVARLDATECLEMIKRIAAVHRSVRTIIFQDDIFVFTKDHRVLPLCEQISIAKDQGELPADLQFISTNRIDAMTPERLEAMRRAGFRVLGFGIENFSRSVLGEFNKQQIYHHIEPVLSEALRLGITPFLDLILTAPRSTLEDLAENARQATRWLAAGCEVGIYPYVIPFSGAAIANDVSLSAHTEYETFQVAGTDLTWRQAMKILPIDLRTREVILAIEREFERFHRLITGELAHVPSRLRSIVWLRAAQRVLSREGVSVPSIDPLLARAPEAVSKALRGQRSRRRSPVLRKADLRTLAANA